MTKDELIARELDQIKGRSQLLLPEEVVEWAQQHKTSALHTCFTWDDTEAARQYRLGQARRVLALRIIPGTQQRQLVSLSIDRVKDGGYRSIETVMKQPDLRKVLLRDALAAFNQVRKRYADLKELADVYAALDKVSAQEQRRAA